MVEIDAFYQKICRIYKVLLNNLYQSVFPYIIYIELQCKVTKKMKNTLI